MIAKALSQIRLSSKMKIVVDQQSWRVVAPNYVRCSGMDLGKGTRFRQRHDFSRAVNENWFREGHRLQPCRHSASLFVLRFSAWGLIFTLKPNCAMLKGRRSSSTDYGRSESETGAMEGMRTPSTSPRLQVGRATASSAASRQIESDGWAAFLARTIAATRAL